MKTSKWKSVGRIEKKNYMFVSWKKTLFFNKKYWQSEMLMIICEYKIKKEERKRKNENKGNEFRDKKDMGREIYKLLLYARENKKAKME